MSYGGVMRTTQWNRFVQSLKTLESTPDRDIVTPVMQRGDVSNAGCKRRSASTAKINGARGLATQNAQVAPKKDGVVSRVREGLLAILFIPATLLGIPLLMLLHVMPKDAVRRLQRSGVRVQHLYTIVLRVVNAVISGLIPRIAEILKSFATLP